MKKAELLEVTEQKFQNLFDFLESHDDEKWNQGPEGKWTTGQHVLHLLQGAKPLNRAMGLPMFFLWYKFGKANRGPRTYDTVEHKYKTKLAAAVNVISPFSKNMPDTPPEGKQDIIAQLSRQKDILLKKIKRISEKNMDTYLIPHPLLGRMLIREMIMWNAIHVDHHLDILKEKYI
ncbi:MAG: DinB family protein [Saprospiraceae bacterium]|nr:DinB family protein [Saprospiraceae bacterium]